MSSRRDDGERGRRDRKSERHNPLERMVSGLVFGLGFGALAIFYPAFHWAGIVAVFAGAFPFVSGLRGLIADRVSEPKRLKQDSAEQQAEAERSILRIARQGRGVVTPALVAIESDVSLEEADKILQAMTAKGHATMQVRDDGRIEYEFREFMEP
jgi:hypothetical protein